eukprot:COSAG02_NODE_9414_length_2224_cov_6.276235_3_plen_169_part_00
MATLSSSASMDEIKWVFDMCGFVLFPSLLSNEDTAQMRAEVEETLAYRQAAGGGLPDGQHMSPGVQRRIPATHEQANPGTVEQPGYLNYLNYGGRCGELLDHPLLNVRTASASQLHVTPHTHTIPCARAPTPRTLGSANPEPQSRNPSSSTWHACTCYIYGSPPAEVI